MKREGNVMTRTATRIARGASSTRTGSTNVVLVRGRLVSSPTMRTIGRQQRVASFDLASVVQGRRSVVPVTTSASNVPAMTTGDEVTVLGYVRRRFFRAGSRTQSITEIFGEQVVLGSRTSKLDKLAAVMHVRIREVRSTVLPKDPES